MRSLANANPKSKDPYPPAQSIRFRALVAFRQNSQEIRGICHYRGPSTAQKSSRSELSASLSMTDANVRGDQRFGFRDAKLSLSISSFTSSSLPPMNVNDIAWLLCTRTSEV